MSLKFITPLALGLLTACAESLVVEPDHTSGAALRPASAASASPSRPMRGACTFVATPVPPATGQPQNVARFLLDADCRFTHLGLTTASAEEIVTFTANGTTAVFTTIYTAANGDRLFTTTSTTGTAPDPNGVAGFSGTETVTGGTGRFAGASGAFSLTGSVAVATLTGVYEVNGSVSY